VKREKSPDDSGKRTRLRGGSSPTRGQRKKWSQAEIKLLKQLYPEHPNVEIARRLKRSLSSVIAQGFKLGLKKSPGRLAQMGQEHMARRWKRKSSGR
jgi:hypothetical protein